MWMRGDNNTQRLEKHVQLEQLTVKKLKPSDEGIYKVLDEEGLSVSTVQLSVEGEVAPDSSLKCSDETTRFSCHRVLASSSVATVFVHVV